MRRAIGFILQLIVVVFAVVGFKSLADTGFVTFDIVFAIVMWALIDFGQGFQRGEKVSDL